MEHKREVIVCFKCNTTFECDETNKCPKCGSLNIHKTDTKPLNLKSKKYI